MSQQVSYGTITIVDTNDIESITIEYNRNQSTSSPPAQSDSGWSTSRPTWAQGYYIWQRTRTHKSGTATTEDEFGTAVCITGSTGSTGQSLTNTKTQYTHVASNVVITTDNHTSYTWTDNVPSYSANAPVYWGRITNTYSNPSKTEYIVYKDNGLTDAIAKSVEANTNAAAANTNAAEALNKANNGIITTTQLWYQTNSTSKPSVPTTHSQEVDNGTNTYNNWRTIRPTNSIDTYPYYYYCYEYKHGDDTYTYSSEAILDTSNLSQYQIGALDTKLKAFFYPGDSDYSGAYAVANGESDGLDTEDISTYGYNVGIRPTNIAIGYNSTPVIQLDGTTGALNIYRFPTISQGTVTQAGTLGMSLGTSSLTFYKPDGSTQSAILDSTGLTLKEGGITGGEFNNQGTNNRFIYLSTKDYANSISINNHSASNWRAIIGTKFGVDNEGNLYASNAIIGGTLTAGANSKIGPWNVTDTSIWYGNSNFGNANGIYLGTSGLSLGSALKITAAGAVTASNITATGGKIGGWNIGTDTNKSLYYGNQTPGATTTNLVLSPTSATNTNAIAGSDTGKTWFISAGRNFGVDTSGNLYATGANIEGKITVGAGSNVYTTDNVNPLQIGGKNLFKDSANLGTTWTKDGGSTVSGGVATINLGSTSGELRIYQMPANGYWSKWEANTAYTVSVDAKVSESGIQLRFAPYAAGVSTKTVSPTTEWKRYSYTFASGSTTATSSCSFFGANATSGYLYLRNPKLEYGNKATDWTPAPEDTINDNLVNGSQKMDGWKRNSNASLNTSSEFGDVTLTGSSSNWLGGILTAPTMRTSILDGSALWLSLEYKASVASTLHIEFSGTSANPDTSPGSQTKYRTWNYSVAATSSWTKLAYSMPILLSELTGGSGDVNSLFVSFYNRTDNSTIHIRKVKLEHGLAPTEWTPSPEDFKTYITRIDDGGIFISPSNQSPTTNAAGNSIKINGDGMEIFKGGTSVAQYGDTARVGKSNSGHVSIASTGIDLYGGDGTIELAHFGYGSTHSEDGVTPAPYYTLGERINVATPGYYSVAEGKSTDAIGHLSHAEGWGSIAEGSASHANGSWTYAKGADQTVIGKWNVKDTTSAFIIGNGSSGRTTGDENRHNALSVDWDGGIQGPGGSYKVVMADISSTEIKAQDSSLTTSSTDDAWLTALLQAICAKYKSRTNTVFKGVMCPNSWGCYEMFIYNTSETSGNVPRYSYGTFRKFNDTFDKFWTNEYAFGYKSVAPSITVSTSSVDNISISANGYAEGSIAVPISGYTVLGVLDTYVQNASSSGSGSSFASIYRTYTSGDTYYYGLRNVTNSAIKVRIYAKILYISAT